MTQPSSSRALTEDKRVRDLRWYCPPSWTSIDEFNDDTLDAAWVRVDSAGGSSRVTIVEGGDSLSTSNAGGDAVQELHALLIPLSSFGGAWSVGDALVTCSAVHSTVWANYGMGGLLLTDGTTYGAGKQIAAQSYITANLNVADDVWAFTNFNAVTSSESGARTQIGASLFHRLVMPSANTWRHDVSLNGVQWWPSTTGLSYTITPTHAGILSSSWGTAIKPFASYEFLRRVSGVS